jgi:hypothetical protein
VTTQKIVSLFGNGAGSGKLWWGRYDIDGVPYRGESAPLLSNEEADRFLEPSRDAKYGMFDTSDREQLQAGRTYQQVLDGITSGVWTLIFRKHIESTDNDGRPKIFVYVEWVESVMELSLEAQSRGRG